MKRSNSHEPYYPASESSLLIQHFPRFKDMAKSIILFYNISNEQGEDTAHPNALNVSVEGSSATFGDVIRSWPFSSATFKFKMPNVGGVSGAPHVWLHIKDHSQEIPVFNGMYFAEVLMDEDSICM